MSKEIALAAYENYIMGKSNNLKLHGTTYEKAADAKEITKYIVNSILRVSPNEAMQMLRDDEKLFKDLHFDLLAKYYKFPVDISPKLDRDYLVHCAFFNDRSTSYSRYQILNIYDRIQKGEMATFPRHVFNGNSLDKAKLLLMKYITENIADTRVENLYKVFANPSITTKLKEKHLFDVCNLHFASPLDYLNYTLDPGTQQNYFLFAVYEYLGVARRIRKNITAQDRQAKKKLKKEAEKQSTTP